MKRTPTPIIPHPMTPSAFADRLFEHLAIIEKPIRRIYSDPKGIPTMGAGFALSHRLKDGTYRLMDRKDIDAAISKATGKPYALSDAEYERLQNANIHLNAGQPDKAKGVIPGVSTDPDVRNDPKLNHFGFTIPDDGQRRLIEGPMLEAQARAWNEFAGRAKARGWTEADINDFEQTFGRSDEMLALASLKYNMGDAKMPRTLDAVLDGDRVEAFDQIAFHTNKDGSPGIANRRQVEGELMLGDRDGLDPADRARVEAIEEARARPAPDAGQIRVEAGDTLSALARRHGTTVEAIAKANGIADPNAIQAGRMLTLPPAAEGGASGANSGPEPSPSPAPAPAADASPSAATRAMATPDAERRPAADAVWEILFQPDDEAEETVLKPLADWTEDEQVRLGRHIFRMPQGDPARDRLATRRRDWFSHVFGDATARLDETGRTIEPRPLRPVPHEPRPASLPDGRSLTEGLERTARLLGGRALEPDGAARGVKALQAGLNLTNPLISTPRLKEDGVLGPKTRLGIKQALVSRGTGGIAESLALGRFRDFAASGRHADLAEETDANVGGLFRNPEKPLAPRAARPESMALQQSLNELGPKALGAAWTPLKEDGWIGPKTTDAFTRLAKAGDPDELTRSIGSFLGFL